MLALQAGRRATCTCLRATATASPRLRLGLSSVARGYATSSSPSTVSSSPSSHPSQRGPGAFPPSTSADAAQGPPSLAETSKIASLDSNHILIELSLVPERSDETPTISARPPAPDNDDRRMEDWVLYHPVYTPAQLKAVEVTRHPDLVFSDKIAGGLVKLFRAGFDIVSRYRHSTPEEALKAAAKQGKTNLSLEEMRKANLTMDPKQWLRRILFLESVAGVPGMVAATLRHLRSLRLMRRDGGFIATLLEEAENERMHLLTFMKIAQPGLFFRLMVLGAQGVFYNLFFLSYLISPKICHRFVGRLEEEAVVTYTNCIKEIEAGRLPEWEKAPAPRIAIDYWRLKEDATLLDVIYAVRADEAGHRFVNHTFANINAFANVAETDFNPFAIQKPSALIQGTSPGFSRQESVEWYSAASKQLKEGKAAAKSD